MQAMEIHREGLSILRLREGVILTMEEMTEAWSRVVARSKKIVQVASCHNVDDVAGSSSARTTARPYFPRPSMFFHQNQFSTNLSTFVFIKICSPWAGYVTPPPVRHDTQFNTRTGPTWQMPPSPRPEQAGGSRWQQAPPTPMMQAPLFYSTSIPPRPEEARGSRW